MHQGSRSELITKGDMASPAAQQNGIASPSRKRKAVVEPAPGVPPATLATLESRLTSLEMKLSAIRKQLSSSKTHDTEEPEAQAVSYGLPLASKEVLLQEMQEVVDDLQSSIKKEFEVESSIGVLEREEAEEMDLDDERALDEVENCFKVLLEGTIGMQSSQTLQKQEPDNFAPMLPPTADVQPEKKSIPKDVTDLKASVLESCSFQSSEALKKQDTKAEPKEFYVPVLSASEEQANSEEHPKISSPIRDCNMKSIAKGVADLEAAVSDSSLQKCILHEFVKIFHPVLKDVPDWISGPYQEFKDDSIRLCSNCQSLCEWIYFLTNSRKEVCASCLTAEGYKESVKTFLREGVAEYLSSLDNAASTLVCPKQVLKNKLSSKHKKTVVEKIRVANGSASILRRVRRVISCEFVREESSTTSLQSLVQAYCRRHKCKISSEKLISVLTILGFKCETSSGGSPVVVHGLKLCNNAGTQ